MCGLYSGSIHPNFIDKEYIRYAEWLPIVKILTSKSYCSGTIIDPKYILSIKHAIEYESNLEIIYNNNILLYDDIIFHPKLDVCLIKISKPIEYHKIEFSEDMALVGKLCVIGGYGIYKKAGEDAKNDSLKRAGNNIVVWESSELFECCMDGVNPVELEFISTPGDSGGPVLISNKLAGINQYIKANDNNTDGSFGDRSGHIKITKIRSWIDKYISN